VQAAVRGAGWGFYFPAAAGLLPQTVPADQRAQANAMYRIGINGAQIGGAALGGILAGLAGPGWGLAVDAVSFAVAGALREEFPAFRIWREANGERTRYVAQRLHPGTRPHTVVTAGLPELRAAIENAISPDATSP
jgi:MFS family permease